MPYGCGVTARCTHKIASFRNQTGPTDTHSEASLFGVCTAVPTKAIPACDTVQGNVWWRLWQSTEARTVLDQEPLMNAEKEAERVFHDLEQVAPAALWDQLLALAAVAAASMLAASSTAALPPARQQLLQ